MVYSIQIPGRLEEYASVLQTLGQESGSTEALAFDALNYLYNQLNTGDDNPCALLRFFRTVAFASSRPSSRL